MRYWITIFLFCLVACSKDKTAEDDGKAPLIQSQGPGNNQEFKVGQTIPISMTITDDSRIYVVHTHISDLTTGQLLKDIHQYPDQTSYSLNENFDAASITSYRIVVIARDISGNESNISINVSAK